MSISLMVISVVTLVTLSQCVHIAYIRDTGYESNDLQTILRSLKTQNVSLPANISVREYVLPMDADTISSEVCDKLDNETMALVLATSCSTLEKLDEPFINLTIPVLGISEPCSSHGLSIIRIPGPSNTGPEVIMSILRLGGFTQTSTLTDFDVFETNHLRDLLSAEYYESSLTLLTSNGSEAVMTSWLEGSKDTDSTFTCLLLILREDLLLKMSQLMSSINVDLNEHIAIIVSDVKDVSVLDPGGFTVFRDTLLLRERVSNLNISTDVNNIQARLEKVVSHFWALFETLKLFKENTPMPSESYCGGQPTSYLTYPGLTETIRQEVTQFMQPFNSKYDVIRLKPANGTMTSEEVSAWSRDKGFETVEGSQMFRAQTQGLGNITLRVGTAEAVPFVRRLPNNTGYEGFCVDILDELASRLNFRYEIIPSPDKMWGTVDDEGNWNGVVEMVRTKQVEIGFGPLTLTSEREEVIDFTKPFSEEGAGIVLRRFEDKNSKIFRMFKPFSETVWVCIAGAVLVVGLTLAIVNCLSPSKEHERREEHVQQRSNGKMKRINTSDNIWAVYESFMEQGAETSPPNISGRFILGFWWIFTILMVASYKANLVAFLTVSFEDKPINSIHDLAAQTNIKPLVKLGSNLYQEMKKGETDTFRKLWTMMQTAPSITTSEEGLELVLTGGYAFLTDQSQIEFLLTRDCENLMSAENLFNIGGLGFMVQESSPLLEMLSFNIIQLQEAGLIRKWRQKWWSASELCPARKVSSNVQSLELESTGGPFLVFAGSTVLAILCLALECIWARGRNCGKGSEESEHNS